MITPAWPQQDSVALHVLRDDLERWESTRHRQRMRRGSRGPQSPTQSLNPKRRLREHSAASCLARAEAITGQGSDEERQALQGANAGAPEPTISSKPPSPARAHTRPEVPLWPRICHR